MSDRLFATPITELYSPDLLPLTTVDPDIFNILRFTPPKEKREANAYTHYEIISDRYSRERFPEAKDALGDLTGALRKLPGYQKAHVDRVEVLASRALLNQTFGQGFAGNWHADIMGSHKVDVVFSNTQPIEWLTGDYLLDPELGYRANLTLLNNLGDQELLERGLTISQGVPEQAYLKPDDTIHRAAHNITGTDQERMTVAVTYKF